MRTLPIVFLILALTFIVIGISGQRAFIYVGVGFLVVALLRFIRTRN
ncbi:MAG TPA: hypothetical protein VGW36_10385 [Pyrinomonadaceae bacterium]|nr:hypothetical protein [Pyrinomonadaceae bacterium]